MTPGRVLVTGSAGRIGKAAVIALRRQGWFVRGYDLAPSPEANESIVGDLTDATSLQEAAAGMQALIHLAACPDDDDFHTKLLPSNLVGVYEMFEAARLAGIKRVIVASSGQVVWWQRFTGPFPISVNTLPTPRGWYACTKVFAEAAGLAYSQTHDADVVAVRLGWCPRSREHAAELAATEWGHDVYLSTGDAGRFFAAALAAPGPLGYRIVFAYSRPVRNTLVDPEPARALGYEPQDQYPAGIEFGT